MASFAPNTKEYTNAMNNLVFGNSSKHQPSHSYYSRDYQDLFCNNSTILSKYYDYLNMSDEDKALLENDSLDFDNEKLDYLNIIYLFEELNQPDNAFHEDWLVIKNVMDNYLKSIGYADNPC